MKKLIVCFALTIGIALPMKVDAQRKAVSQAAQRSATGQNMERSGAAAAQASSQRQPAFTLTGRMVANRIATRTSDDRPGFDYVLTGARVVNGQLELQGTVSSAGSQTTMPLTAMLAGTMARARNPWPRAADAPVRERPASVAAAASGQQPATQQQQGREARSSEAASALGQLSQTRESTYGTPTQTPTPPQGQGGRRPAESGEVTEQTQSLYAAADTGSGCELMFLKMQLPAALAAAARARQAVQLGVVLAPQDNKMGEQINNSMCRIVRALDAKQSTTVINAQLADLKRLLAQAAASTNNTAAGRSRAAAAKRQ